MAYDYKYIAINKDADQSTVSVVPGVYWPVVICCLCQITEPIQVSVAFIDENRKRNGPIRKTNESSGEDN